MFLVLKDNFVTVFNTQTCFKYIDIGNLVRIDNVVTVIYLHMLQINTQVTMQMDIKTNLVLNLEGEVKSSGMFFSGLPKVVLLKSRSKFRHHLIKSLNFLIRIPSLIQQFLLQNQMETITQSISTQLTLERIISFNYPITYFSINQL